VLVDVTKANAMNILHRLLIACLPLTVLAACGGGDTEDRLDVRDPVVRFVHAAPNAPELTLYRGDDAQSDATATSYKFGSDYVDVSMVDADWSVKTTSGNTTLGSVTIDPDRGTRYTIVAYQTSASANGVALITDPYNKSLTSDDTRVRLMNASFNAANVDLYLEAPNTNIANAGAPLIASTQLGAAGPESGDDSVDKPSGTYQLTITTAGTKTVLFQGELSFGDNKDILLLTVPDDPAVAGSIKVLAKVDGDAGANEVPPL
jgi:hypothetical protein